MLFQLVPTEFTSWMIFLGILFAFVATVMALAKLSSRLPKNHGRDYAVEGERSVGKPQGAGIIFIWVFVISSLLFAPLSAENTIYMILLIICMMTGYLDDASKIPWGEYKKGFLDLCVAILVALTYLHFNPSEIGLALPGITLALPPVVLALGIIVLVWVSVNVTNCSDGVDGLSGTLGIITVMTIYFIDQIRGKAGNFSFLILIFAVCILGYLWYNAAPSKLMMGDAGSRSMGLFISIAVLKTGYPFLYILVALMLILDGGLGLVKIALLRFCKIHFLSHVRLPLHDHVRKQLGWSNTQTVYRFAIIQIMLALAVIFAVLG